MACAVTESNSPGSFKTTKADAFVSYFNALNKYPGLFGDYSFSPQQHNGFPTEEVVMSAANSQRDGAYALAPGYA